MARRADERAEALISGSRVGRAIALAVAASMATAATAAPDWVHFYDSDSLIYFYDPASVVPADGKVFVRGKMTIDGFTSVFEVRIDCARRTFTEVNTTITDDKGRITRVPDNERYVGRPIDQDTSGDKMRAMFCPSA